MKHERPKVLSDDELMQQGFERMLKESAYTRNDVEEAYALSLSGEVSQEVAHPELVQYMRNMIARKIPLNRIADGIEFSFRVAAIETAYENLIKDLKVSNREQDMLRKILKERPTGTLQLLRGDAVHASVDLGSNGVDEIDYHTKFITFITENLALLKSDEPRSFMFST